MSGIKKIIFALLFLFFSQGLNSQTCERDNIFYIGLGSGFSSFVGGDFGSRFAIRVGTSYNGNNSYYSNQNYYYERYDPDYYYDDETSLYPLQFDIVFGARPSEALAFELSTGLRWHSNGHPNPEYEYGTHNGMDYTDRYDYSTLMTVPLTASIKFYPLWKMKVPVYLTAGYSFMYTSEDVERVREFYDYNYYGYEYSLYEYPLALYSSSKWLHGMKAGMGFTYNIMNNMAGDIELAYTNYWSEVRNGSPLAMFRTKNIGNISLNMRVIYGF